MTLLLDVVTQIVSQYEMGAHRLWPLLFGARGALKLVLETVSAKRSIRPKHALDLLR